MPSRSILRVWGFHDVVLAVVWVSLAAYDVRSMVLHVPMVEEHDGREIDEREQYVFYDPEDCCIDHPTSTQ